MTNNELLLAISDMMDKKLDEKLDKKLDEKLEPIYEKLDKKLDEKLDKKLDEKLEPIYEKLDSLEGRVKKIELTQESDIIPRLQNIEACYLSTFERYQKSISDHEAMKQDIALIKKVVLEHSERFQLIAGN